VRSPNRVGGTDGFKVNAVSGELRSNSCGRSPVPLNDQTAVFPFGLKVDQQFLGVI